MLFNFFNFFFIFYLTEEVGGSAVTGNRNKIFDPALSMS